MYPDNTIKLANSTSEQNIYCTYVCLVNNIKPSSFDIGQNQPSVSTLNGESEEIEQEEKPIQVERSKALHLLVAGGKKENGNTDKQDNEANSSLPNSLSTDTCENEDNLQSINNAKLLRLTKMKWLTEEQDESPDSSSPFISATNSSASTSCSKESEEALGKCISTNDKCLSTILRLDKEHNMFGLSNITIDGSRPSKKMRKDDEKAVFHQTAIVQVCCGNKCCKHTSKTDLPPSLKCGGCLRRCMDCSMICSSPCSIPCCTSGPIEKCNCKGSCLPTKCMVDCCSSFGMKIAVKRRPKPDPMPVEITPRSSCVLQKPLAARSCHHFPRCLPPSSCFPYLMPCFWPSRPGAPCNTPSHCFHNPPCRPPRRPKSKLDLEKMCPPGSNHKCTNKQQKCENQNCLSNTKKEHHIRF